MAEEHQNKSREYEAAVALVKKYEAAAAHDEVPVESKERGMFDFFGKKEEEKPQEEVISEEFAAKVHVSEPAPEVKEHKEEEEEKKHSLLEKLHRSNSSSSSSSDEEDESGEKKKKKKGLKEKRSGDKDEKCEEVRSGDKDDKCEEVAYVPNPQQLEERKGFLEEIKEKIPGHDQKAEDVFVSHPNVACAPTAAEPKGLKENIKEKISGDEHKHVDTSVPVEKYQEEVRVPEAQHHEEKKDTFLVQVPEPQQHEEKQGFLEKIKGKLPGQHKKVEDVPVSSPRTEPTEAAPSPEGEGKEKKGIFEKIKDKIPGFHPAKSEVEKEKEKEKEGAPASSY